jgi:hypothetical protein
MRRGDVGPPYGPYFERSDWLEEQATGGRHKQLADEFSDARRLQIRPDLHGGPPEMVDLEARHAELFGLGLLLRGIATTAS